MSCPEGSTQTFIMPGTRAHETAFGPAMLRAITATRPKRTAAASHDAPDSQFL